MGSSKSSLPPWANDQFETTTWQGFLPPELRRDKTGPIIESGIEGIGNLIRNPGKLSPNVAEAIQPRLAAESETIAQNFRGLGSQQAGAAARGNTPLSIKSALSSALDVAQERAQRGARRDALMQSEALRREDLGKTFSLLESINQFMQGRLGPATAGAGADAQADAQKQAATMAAIAAIAGAAIMASNSRFKEDIVPVANDNILNAIKALPVYEWSYKGDNARHVGPLAEDFLATFGLGNTPDGIYTIDAIGTLMAATQALAEKVDRLEAR